ncbi:A/G-specific adenine glycosylase [Aquimarina sp. W85]|uniref:A/G-specific adenine glycosylase n=1 Tax=Aquimarina rhodophyticola TaxID=3342246 RepID=UPI0036718B4C
MEFGKKLIIWYLEHKRDMPWRQTKDPYSIWLSEIILQQTRVRQGLPYYLAFKSSFPTVFDLAAASEEKVLKLWQGLGYYSRARNLHFTAQYVVNEYNGIFPKDYNGLIKLKGIGDYTASAIASICYKEVVPVIDGNVYRVLSRIFGIETPINSSPALKEFKGLAAELIDRTSPDVFNQAIMEFGAIQCKPQSPDCTVCPFNDRCFAMQNNKVSVLPVKLKKLKIKKRYFNYIIFKLPDGKVMFQQRKNVGIWEGLYEFPLIESDKLQEATELQKEEAFLQLVTEQPFSLSIYKEEPIIHKLSHQHLYTRFYIVALAKAPILKENQYLISAETIHEYPVPVLIGNFIESFF